MGLGERLERSLRGVLAEATNGFSHRELGQHLLAELGRHVRFDAACSATLDPATLMWTSCEVLGGRDLTFEARLFDVEYRREDVAKLTDIARRASPVAVLSVETQGDLARSERYREVHVPAGLGDEIRLLLMDGGVSWGCLHLSRELGARPFSRADATALARLSAPLARALRHTLLRMALRAGAAGSAHALALIQARRDGTLETSDDARAILGTAPGAALHAAVHGLILRARAGQLARVSCPTADGGWAILHATRLGADVGLIVERARPVDLADVVVSALGLSPRERTLVAAVARGLSTKEIASALGISEWTVQDHLKSIFAKANVTSRQALVAAIFFGHWAPPHERGALPSPHGHFLLPREPGRG
jgi:DNA-binding CsgD family transcriptional regulator